MERMKILIVDDEPCLRTALARVLGRDAYEYLYAGNGVEALELFRAGNIPDLVITDVLMLLMSGPILVEALAAKHPDLPILMMSGDVGKNGSVIEALRQDEKIVALLQKPFDVQRIQQEVKKIDSLRPENPSPEDTAKFVPAA